MKDEQTVKALTYGELMLLCEGHGTSQIYERHREALAASERAVWLEAASAYLRWKDTKYPKPGIWRPQEVEFDAWCLQQAEAVKP